jgi:hypothetical protein
LTVDAARSHLVHNNGSWKMASYWANGGSCTSMSPRMLQQKTLPYGTPFEVGTLCTENASISYLTKHHEQLQFRFTPQQHVAALTVYHVQYLTFRGSVAVVRRICRSADLTTGHPLDQCCNHKRNEVRLRRASWAADSVVLKNSWRNMPNSNIQTG